jgi:hypothetical protein
VTGGSTSNIKAKELDGPLAGRASVIGGALQRRRKASAATGRSPTSAAGPVAREMKVFGIGRLITVGIGVKRRAWIVRVRAKEGAVM